MIQEHHLIDNVADQQTAAVAPAWRAKADRLRLKHRIARITGHAFTDFEYQEFDNMGVLDHDAQPRRKTERRNEAALDSCSPYDETKQPPLFGLLSEDDLFALEASDGLSGPERAWIGERRKMLSSGRWRDVRAGQSSGHHPYQYHAKKRLQSGQKKKVHFPEIALDAEARKVRLILELVRLTAVSKREDERGSVVGSKILYRSSLDHIIQKGLRGGVNGRRSKRIKQALSDIFSVCWKNLDGEWKRIFKQGAMMANSGNFVTFSLNLGNALLEKHKANESRDTLDAWHKRIDSRLRRVLNGLDYSYALERDSKGRWHIHGIVYNMHEDDFNERYAANLRDAGGKYSEQAEDHQLHIQGGYGFEQAIGWAGYSTKTNRTLTSRDTIWRESQDMTRAGKELFDYARAVLTSHNARRKGADDEADSPHPDTPAKPKVLDKTKHLLSEREKTDTAISKSERTSHQPVPGIQPECAKNESGAHRIENPHQGEPQELGALIDATGELRELSRLMDELDAEYEAQREARHQNVMNDYGYLGCRKREPSIDDLLDELDAELELV